MEKLYVENGRLMAGGAPLLLRGFGLPYAAWGETVRRARAGEPEAAAVLQREAAILAVGILNAATFLDMEAVLLDGDLLEAFDLLRGPIEQTVNGTGLARNKDIPGFDTFFATDFGGGRHAGRVQKIMELD